MEHTRPTPSTGGMCARRNGRLSMREIADALSVVDVHISQQGIQDLLQKFDMDKDEHINYR